MLNAISLLTSIDDFSRAGKYRKITSKKQEDEYLSNHPFEKPIRREKLKPAAENHTRPVTWFIDHLQNPTQSSEDICEDSNDIVYPKSNLRKSKLTASEPFLATTGNSNLKKEKSSRLPAKLFSFNFVKLREKATNKSSSAQSSPSEKSSRSSRPISNYFFTTNMKQRNSDSSNPAPLLEALENKRMRTAFFEFLSSEYSSENLCFWLSCEKYRKIKNNDERFKEGQEIYTQYISNNSPLQINIDHVTRRQITITMTCGDDIVPADVFDRAQGKVFSIMENDSYPRFVASKYYKDAVSTKKTSLESVFSTFLPGSVSPTLPWNKNINNNSTKDHLTPPEDDDKSNVFRRFSFGFKKSNKSKEVGSDFTDANFFGVELKIA